MAGMGDGYVGTSQDAVRIRRLEKQRDAERRKIEELKNKTASTQGQPGLLQFGSGTSEVFLFPFVFWVFGGGNHFSDVIEGYFDFNLMKL